MPTVKGITSVAANTTITNVLSGSAYEFLPWDASIVYGLTGSATGLECTVQSGSDVLMEESPISLQNRVPIFPEDFDLQDAAPGGAQQKIRVQNTTGGALTLFWTLMLTPI